MTLEFSAQQSERQAHSLIHLAKMISDNRADDALDVAGLDSDAVDLSLSDLIAIDL